MISNRESNLLDRGCDVAERGAELAAEALHDGDDRNRDAGGDEAVFNGRRAGLIAKEALKQSAHVLFALWPVCISTSDRTTARKLGSAERTS